MNIRRRRTISLVVAAIAAASCSDSEVSSDGAAGSTDATITTAELDDWSIDDAVRVDISVRVTNSDGSEIALAWQVQTAGTDFETSGGLTDVDEPGEGDESLPSVAASLAEHTVYAGGVYYSQRGMQTTWIDDGDDPAPHAGANPAQLWADLRLLVGAADDESRIPGNVLLGARSDSLLLLGGFEAKELSYWAELTIEAGGSMSTFTSGDDSSAARRVHAHVIVSPDAAVSIAAPVDIATSTSLDAGQAGASRQLIELLAEISRQADPPCAEIQPPPGALVSEELAECLESAGETAAATLMRELLDAEVVE